MERDDRHPLEFRDFPDYCGVAPDLRGMHVAYLMTWGDPKDETLLMEETTMEQMPQIARDVLMERAKVKMFEVFQLLYTWTNEGDAIDASRREREIDTPAGKEARAVPHFDYPECETVPLLVLMASLEAILFRKSEESHLLFEELFAAYPFDERDGIGSRQAVNREALARWLTNFKEAAIELEVLD